jgi:peroxin-19
MEALMRELGGAPPPAAQGDTGGEDERARAQAFAAAWEALLVEGMDAKAGPGVAAPTSTSAQGAPSAGAAGADAEDAFARTIRETMARMQNSEANLRVRATHAADRHFTEDAKADAAADADPLAALLASLGGEGEGGDDELSGMLEGMMGQLMTKEVLYEPLKELGDKVCLTSPHPRL